MITFNFKDDIIKMVAERFRMDFSAIYRDIGNLMLTYIALQFKTSGREFGDGWAPLAPSTIRQRQRLGYADKKGNAKILMRTSGDAGLLGSINVSTSADGIEIGTNKFYGIFHQEGTVKMPARPFLPTQFTQSMLDDIADIIANHIRL